MHSLCNRNGKKIVIKMEEEKDDEKVDDDDENKIKIETFFFNFE